MKLMNIASGSSGNCSMVGTDQTTVLVDAGISMKRIEAGLATCGLTPRDLDGIFITHEHADHIHGLGVISRKYNIPIYGTMGTLDGALKSGKLGTFDFNLLHGISANGTMTIGDLKITSHSISHDAADPVCYKFEEAGDDKEKVVTVATDIGYVSEDLIDFLQGADAMLIEANHDVRMLEAGPYPFYLKQRILGDHGHLSNEASGRMIKTLLNDHIKMIQLGHLSKENNFKELAFETVKLELDGNEFSNDVRDFNLCVASRLEPSDLLEF